jgi:WhiB family redox-sensing transcriptional regulator
MGTPAPQNTTTTGWERDARCRDADVPNHVFFSEDLGEIATAKRVCATCPVMAACLEQAIHNQEPWGVWGGQLFLNGRMLAIKRRRGRPPKHPRPEDQLPQIPIPEHLQALVRTA